MLFIFFILPLLFFGLVAWSFTGQSILKLTGQQTLDKMKSAFIIEQNSEDDLYKNVKDYARWDEMYDQVQKKDPAWLKTNFTDWIPSNFDVDWILGTDIKGNIYYAYNNLPEYQKDLDQFSPINLALKGERSAGLLVTSRGLMRIAAAPIVHSDGTGPINGALLYGTLITSDSLAAIKKILNVDVAFHYDRETMISTDEDVFSGNPHDEMAFFADTANSSSNKYAIFGNQIIAMQPLLDIGGNKIGILALAKDNTGFSEIIRNILFTFVITAILSLIFIFIFILLIIRSIRKPLWQLSSAMKTMHKGNDYPLYRKVDIQTNDELGELATSFNSMIENLNDYRDKLKKRTNELMQERNLAEREKEKTAIILKSIGDGVLVVDSKGKIEFINQITENLTGWSLAEAKGFGVEKIFNIFDEETMIPRKSPIYDAMKTGKIKNLANHTVLKTKEGQIIPIADSAAPLKNAQGKIIGAVMIFRDIISERLAEMRVIQAKDKLEELNNELDKKIEQKTVDLKQALEELKGLDALKDEFLNISAHELKTPLTSIIGLTELILLKKQGGINKQQEKSLQIVNNESSRLLNIIKKILNITRIEAKKAVFDLQPLNPCDILPQVVESLKTLAKNTAVQIICKRPQRRLFVKADPEKLQEVVYNLIDNALKFSPPKGKVFVSGTIKDNEFIFSVKDQGPGIDLESQKKLFQKFSQLDTGLNREQEGTGLGLYICKIIIESMGGKIWAESEIGKGATFQFSLPLAKEKKNAN